MKFKYVFPLALVIKSFVIIVIGLLFKLQHWPYGSEILTVGNLLGLVGVILIIVFIVKSLNFREKRKD